MRRVLLKTPPEDRDVLTVLAASAPANRRTDVSRILLWILGGLVILLLIALFVLAGWATSQATTRDVSLASSSGQSNGVFGEPVRDGQFEFVVGDLTCATEIPSAKSADPVRSVIGQLCSAPMHVSNVGNQPRLVSCSWMKAHLSGGEVVSATRWATDSVNGARSTEWLGSGSQKSLTLVFDISLDQHIVSLELHDFTFSRGARISQVSS